MMDIYLSGSPGEQSLDFSVLRNSLRSIDQTEVIGVHQDDAIEAASFESATRLIDERIKRIRECGAFVLSWWKHPTMLNLEELAFAYDAFGARGGRIIEFKNHFPVMQLKRPNIIDDIDPNSVETYTTSEGLQGHVRRLDQSTDRPTSA